MNTQPTHIDSLNKVMNETHFVYSGVIVTRLICGYEVLGQKVKTMEEVDEVIKKGYNYSDRKSTRLNSSHRSLSRMPSSA